MAFYAGLIGGAVFLTFSGGTPWSSGGNFTAMGRALDSAEDVQRMSALTSVVVHMGLAVAYALIIAPVVDRFRSLRAVLLGGLCGLGLYFLNYLIAVGILGLAPYQREYATLLTHVVFGMVAAGIYKGLARPRAAVA